MPRHARSPSSSNLLHTQSDTDVTNIPPNTSTTAFVSQRNKRQRQSSDEELISFKDEIRMMLDEWKETQNTLLNKLMSEILEIKKQNNQIKLSNEEIAKSLDFLNAQYEDMKTKVEGLQTERKQFLSQIASLEEKIEDMQKTSKLTAVEIRNVPIPTKTETKSDLCNIVKNTCKVLNVNVEQMTIKDIYRINGKSSKGTIIAEFTTVVLKKDVIQAAKNYNKQHPNQRLNSSIIGLSGPTTPIFISEALTNKGRRLFFLARDFAKTQDFNYCWTNNGRVYLRKTSDSPHIEIKTETQLSNLKNQK
ncbi:uncharacterized protein LOC124534919 [Vanessa cardui]|uniref:uncharacterized protein LOC124534919 n=1 Tax=Vanessa cardui TaxID=171605 RepID=UPI001F1356C9|nr:uncharacterized protein LOC124534919 [Vanessa cardui]